MNYNRTNSTSIMSLLTSECNANNALDSAISLEWMFSITGDTGAPPKRISLSIGTDCNGPTFSSVAVISLCTCFEPPERSRNGVSLFV